MASPCASISAEYDEAVVKLHSKSDVRKLTTDNFDHRNEMDNTKILLQHKNKDKKKLVFDYKINFVIHFYIFCCTLIEQQRERDSDTESFK